MGRISKVDDSSVYDAVGMHLAAYGSVKLQDVVETTGVSIGSLYHRYGSREALLARAWLDAVLAFQARFLGELERDTPDAGECTAIATPRFCREEPARARLLICCRREQLMPDQAPTALRAELDAANKATYSRIAKFAEKNGYGLDACHLGLVAYPVGAVRLYLPKRAVPEIVDDHVAAAFRSAVNLS